MRVRSSRQAADGGSLLSTEHWNRLRVSLKTVHREFQRRYEVPEGAPFAMEVEFKVTADGRFVIKQARPWVF